MDTNGINDNLNEMPLNEENEKIVDKKEDAAENVVSAKEQEAEVVDENSTQNTAEHDEAEHDEASDDDIDYNTLDYVGLVNALRDIVAGEQNHSYIQNRIKIIQSVFYNKLNDERKVAREKYIEINGDATDYKVEPNVYEDDIKRFTKEYKTKRAKDRENDEQEKEENYKKKVRIIEEIKKLVDKEETLNQTFNEFRNLQQQWKEVGDVPQSNVREIWRSYHFSVECFYDYVNINKELRELDLKKNLQRKTRICEEVEKLQEEDNVNKAFNELQRFHEQWREIGPVPREVNEEIWERFKVATRVINNKHHEFIGSRRVEEKDNLEKKEALCEKVQTLLEKLPETPKDWDAATGTVISIQEEWKTIGRAPKSDHDKVWKRFRSLCDDFFGRKRNFFSGQKEVKEDNYKLKLELCEKAEELQDSTEWGRTTDKLIHLQKEWKTVGPVDRKVSDKVWKRFRAACNKFFDRKKEEFSASIEEEQMNMDKKLAVIEKVKALKSTGEYEQDLEAVKALQEQWNAIGFVPFKDKDKVYEQYSKALDVAFDTLRINKQEQKIMDLTSKIKGKGKGLNENLIYREREKLSSKLRHLEEERTLLDNNVGFFANTKNAEALINEVNIKVENIEQQIATIKEQIKIIDNSLTEDEN